MAKRKPDIIHRFVNQVERNANKLRKDLRRFSKNTDLPHKLEELSGELRRGAASVASEVEHYLHDLRYGSSSSATKASKRAGKAVKTRRKAAAKKTTGKAAARKTTRKAAAKKTTRKAAKKTARKAAKKSTRKAGPKSRS